MSKPTSDKRRTSLPVEATFATREDGAPADRTIRFIASTTGVARDGGIVESWDLTNYAKNPVVLWSHNPDVPPIAKATRAEMTARGLEIDAEFAGAGETAEHRLADIVFKLYRTGFLRSVSVGFRAVSDREPTDKERAEGARWVCRGELFELSAVAVPADPGAVATDRALIARTFTASDLSVAKTQLGAIEPWQPILHRLEAALVESVPTPSRVAVTSARAAHDHAACEELRDHLTRALELLEDMHAQEEAPRSETTSEGRAASQEALRPVAVEEVGAKAPDAPSQGRAAEILAVLERHYPCRTSPQ